MIEIFGMNIMRGSQYAVGRKTVPNRDAAELKESQTSLSFDSWTVVERTRVCMSEMRIRMRSEERGRSDGRIVFPRHVSRGTCSRGTVCMLR